MAEVTALGDLISIQRGTTYKSVLLGQPGPHLLGLASIARNGGFRSDSLRTYGGESPESLLVKPGELFASLKDVTQAADLLGSVARLPRDAPPGRLTQDTVRLDIISNRVNPDYLYWLLRAPEYRQYCRAHATGTTNLGLPREDFLGFPVRLPPLDEQRRTAEVLGALDDLIDTNERLATSAAELRTSILDAAFQGAAEQRPLSSIARFVNGKNFTKGADGSGRPIIRTPEVREGVKPTTLHSSVEVTDDFIARAGDLLFVWSGSLCIGRWTEDEALVNQHVFKVIPNEGVPDWYVYACLEWKLPWFLGLAADKATTMGHIQRAHLDAAVPSLSDDALARLGDQIRPLWELELELRGENQQLRRTRDELLPLLMSGAVRVRPEGIAA